MANNKKDMLKGLFSATIIRILVFLTVLLLAAVIVLGNMLYREKAKHVPTPVIVKEQVQGETVVKKYEITVQYLEKALANISELSTAELSYTGICTVEEGTIPYITQKGFSMLYKGSVKAGIDASRIEIEITDETVVIRIPKAEIQLVKIDPQSIQFYDEKKALFNWTELSDSIDGLVLAEENIKSQAEMDEILERADQQAEAVVKGLLEDIVKEAEGGRTLKIEKINESEDF